MRRCSKLLLAAAALLAAPAAAQEAAPLTGESAREQVALMGTVPIYWGEAEGFAELLSGAAPAHWARAAIERHAEPVPLDYLSEEALAPHRYLIMAQPRGLTGEENVALDAWVRGGGRLLLFADPLMTGESRFHLGDRRRPQDVALLSPILAHWGLSLQFDAEQADGPAAVDHLGLAIPVNMRGSFAALPQREECAVSAGGLLARCAIDSGAALLVADAAVLDITGPWPGAQGALEALLDQAFPDLAGDFGDSAGSPAASARETAGNRANASIAPPDGAHDHGGETLR